MIVSELLNTIKINQDYVEHSLVLKSSDSLGATYKWLVKCGAIAVRKEMFISTIEEDSGLDILERIILSYIEVYPAR